MTFTISTGLAAAIHHKIADYVGEEPDAVDFRTDYSGRGMYGAECVAVVGGDEMPFVILLAMQEIAREEAQRADNGNPFRYQDYDDEQFVEMFSPDFDAYDLLEFLRSGSNDNMGFETITYWRDLTVAKGSDA